MSTSMEQLKQPKSWDLGIASAGGRRHCTQGEQCNNTQVAEPRDLSNSALQSRCGLFESNCEHTKVATGSPKVTQGLDVETMEEDMCFGRTGCCWFTAS